MLNVEPPIPGEWYRINDSDPQHFIVIDCDDSAECISIQFEDGFADEIDLETWEQWAPEQVELADHHFIDPSADAGYDEALDLLTESVVRDIDDDPDTGVPDADFAA